MPDPRGDDGGHRSLGLRSRLITVITCTLLPAFGILIWDAVGDVRAASETAKAEARRLAVGIAEARGREIAAARESLRTLSLLPDIAFLNPERCWSLLSRFLRAAPGLTNIAIADADGDVLCSVKSTSGKAGAGDRPYFRRAVGTGDFAVGGFVIGRVSGRPALPIAYPVKSWEGDTAAVHSVLIAGIDLEWLSGRLDEAHRRLGGMALSVLDGDGIVLSRAPETAGEVGKPHPDPGVRAAVREGRVDGVTEGLGGAGRAMVFGLARIGAGAASSYVVVGRPSDELLTDVRRTAAVQALALAAVIFVSLVVAWIAGGRLVIAPLARLGRATERLAAGDMGARSGAPYAAGELGAVARAFDRMADTIEHRQEEIERARGALEDEVRERRRVDAALVEAHELMTGIVAASPVAIVALDHERVVRAWNPAAERIFGCAADAAVGHPLDIAEGEERDRIAALLGRIAGGERVTGVEVRCLGGEGRAIEIALSGAPFAAGSTLALEDVTERKATEAQLRQSQKMEALGQLVGGVAHDFNNLLTIIIGNIELLGDRLGGDDRAARQAASIAGAGQRAADLTKRLLAFARRQPLEPKRLALDALVRDTERMLARTLGADVEIATRTEPGLWDVEADPSLLQNALVNLAVNARDAMPRGGRLLIETSNAALDEEYARRHDGVAPGSYACVAVTDTGTGMPPDVLARAFDPFFTTKAAGKGTGLGLSMVFGFAKQSGGHAAIYSEVGVGTSVRLYLPRATGGRPAAEDSAPDIGAFAGAETILVVDDVDDVREVAVSYLEGLGYRVAAAAGAADALDLLRRDPDIRLLFTDYVMPGSVNGVDLAAEAARLKPGLRILLASGLPRDIVTLRSGLAADVDLVSKPYDRLTLARKVRTLLDGD